MGNKILYTLLLFLGIEHLNAQFASVDITFDDRLLRSDEKQEIFALREDINRFLYILSGMKFMTILILIFIFNLSLKVLNQKEM